MDRPTGTDLRAATGRGAVGRMRAFAIDARRALRQAAVRGQLGPTGASADRSGRRR